jgi:hypothetical protein
MMKVRKMRRMQDGILFGFTIVYYIPAKTYIP